MPALRLPDHPGNGPVARSVPSIGGVECEEPSAEPPPAEDSVDDPDRRDLLADAATLANWVVEILGAIPQAP